jgi:O-acetyl-ADP-ribose deacetylase (regulator of RNase III)
MDQDERRLYLIRALIDEEPRYAGLAVPPDEAGRRDLLRALLNVRPPREAAPEFLAVQDAYLREELARRGVTRLEGLSPAEPGLYLWQGDITTLACDAVVNAANSGMTGCYHPNHRCIDNAIHTFAGVQLRLACARLMERQGHAEKTGGAKVTPAFNLPSSYVLHTVGPVVEGAPAARDDELLASCYRSCLDAAEECGARSVAFCCVSTGEFHFPNERAARVAVATVRAWRAARPDPIEVIFNVFKDVDLRIYRQLLG